MPTFRFAIPFLIAPLFWAVAAQTETIRPFGERNSDDAAADRLATTLDAMTAPDIAASGPSVTAERPFDIFTTLGAMLPPSEWARRDRRRDRAMPAAR